MSHASSTFFIYNCQRDYKRSRERHSTTFIKNYYIYLTISKYILQDKGSSPACVISEPWFTAIVLTLISFISDILKIIVTTIEM